MKYYYLIPEDAVVYAMIKYSVLSLTENQDPTREELIACKKNMRVVVDTTDGTKYVLIKMGLDFSTPFKGYHAYTTDEVKVMLEDVMWLHNKVVA